MVTLILFTLDKVEVEEPPAKLLDDLFRKTKATPCIYWLPLTEEQVCCFDTNYYVRSLNHVLDVSAFHSVPISTDH